MLDAILWIVLIIGVIYYIRTKTFLFKNDEKIFENELKELEKYTRKYVESAEKFKDQSSKEIAKREETRLQNFAKAYENYLHLKERYRHDRKTNQIKNDWKTYLKAISHILETQMDYGMSLDHKMLLQAHKRIDKAEIVIAEIEKRFKQYLKD